jgi:alpha-beta hydrolase superfamily lysophospholipase
VEALRKAGHQRAELKLYEEMRHEVLNEKDRTAVYDDIEAFIKDVIERDGAAGQRLG